MADDRRFQHSNLKISLTANTVAYLGGVPGRCLIEEIRAVSETVASTTLTFYNRLLATAVSSNLIVITKESGAGTRAVATLTVPGYAKAGDQVTIAGSSVGGYNTNHRVVSVSANGLVLLLETTFTSEGTGGSLNLNIPTNEIHLYEVLPPGGITVASNVGRYFADGYLLVYMNEDPVVANAAGGIYLKAAHTTVVRLAFRGENGIG